MFPPALADMASRILDRCRQQGVTLATAESCTGGLLSACLTAIPGSSDVFERGFVTYSDRAKTESLGVPAVLVRDHGAVSAPVAQGMAEGALQHSGANLAISITGIAGPGGGSGEKPVGLVYIGLARRGQAPAAHRFMLKGSRDVIRLQAVETALNLVEQNLS